MPCYPALALLLGHGLAGGGAWIRRGTGFAGVVAGALAVVLLAILVSVWDLPTPGDISLALASNPDAYTLSLGHMLDLTQGAFAYLRLPLFVAAVACIAGATGIWLSRPVAALTAMMVLFFHAARLAMVTFDPYLSSRSLADALRAAPPGEVIFDNQYYMFSSVFFYANTRGWLLNGRVNNLEYGSYAPGAPAVFLDDAQFARRWRGSQLHYLLIEGPSVPRVEKLVGEDALQVVRASGGKYLFSNVGITRSR